MKRVRAIFAVAAAIVSMMTFASPAFASTDGGCIHIPFSTLTAYGPPATFASLLIQLAVVVGIVMVAAVALAPASTAQPPTPTGTPQAAS
jgi:hypothetical protein